MKMGRQGLMRWLRYGRAWLEWRLSSFGGALDGPLDGEMVVGPIEVWGWSAGRRAAMRRVEMWLDGQPVGEATYGLERPDVALARPWQGRLDCGFRGRVEAGPGAHQLVVRVLDERGRQHEWISLVTVVPPAVLSVSPEYSYADWIRDTEPTEEVLTYQREAVMRLAYRPRFSLLTPVYNPPLPVLREMVASVQAQTYPDWELCLVDGASSEPGMAQFLEEAAASDARIRLTRLAENAGIVGNSNEALAMATGDFCVLLDHDDRIAPDALYEVALALNARPDLGFIYSDHDLLSEDGLKRHSPLFKPDFSPEIMLSANYLTHLSVIRRDLIEAVGGFAPGTDGAQDWDLFWRVLERLSPPQIGHIPKVLYHWRESASSTATDIYRKPAAPLNGLKAIEGHLHRTGQPSGRAFFQDSLIRVGWPLVSTPLVSIIVPTKDKPELITKCVRTVLERTSYPHFELLVVDTGSTDSAVASFYALLEAQPRVKLLHYSQPFNYSAVNNWASRQAAGEILVFLNNDTEVVASDWLEELVRWAQQPAVGAVGGQLLKPDGTLQHAGVIVGMGGFAGHVLAGHKPQDWTIFGSAGWYRDYTAVTAACMAMRREVFDELGGFDEAFELNGSDVDLCLKVRANGYRVVYNPFVRLYHLESATVGGRGVPTGDYTRSLARYEPLLRAGDPFFNPNLSYFYTRPTLRRPHEPAPLSVAQDFVNNQ